MLYYILFKPNTSNLYFLDIFPADMSGELLPAVGGRQDGKEDSVLMKSGYAREVVVTRWLDQRMGQIQTPQDLGGGPQISMAIFPLPSSAVKVTLWLFGQEERVCDFDRCQFWGFCSFR